MYGSHRVIILPGVTIGKGTVIGAGSVVTTTRILVVAGNPSTVINTEYCKLLCGVLYENPDCNKSLPLEELTALTC